MKTQVNEIKIVYRERVAASQWPKVKSSKDMGKLLYDTWDKDTIALHETFKVVLLNNSNEVKLIYPLSVGGLTGTLVDIRILFALALKTLSVAIILTHNHPSGSLKASDADKALTQRIKNAAHTLDIKLLDHILIVPNGDYYSFADNGLI